MNSPDTTEISKFIRHLAEGFRGGGTPGSLKAPASRYAALCEEANRRLARCAEMLREGGEREHAALMEAMRSPDLRELSIQLSDPSLNGWREFCEKNGLAVPVPVNREALRQLDSVYATLGGGSRNVSDAPAADATPEIPVGRSAGGPVTPALQGGGHARAATVQMGPISTSRSASPSKAASTIGSRGMLFTAAGIGIAAVAAAALAVPGMIERSKAGRLSSDLDLLMSEGRWEEAGELAASGGEIVSESGENPPLSESLSVLHLADELRGLAQNLHHFPGYREVSDPGVLLDGIDVQAAGSGFDWNSRPRLSELRQQTGRQLEGWQTFQKSTGEYWTDLAGLKPPAEAPEEGLGQWLAEQEPDPANHAAGQLAQLGGVADAVREFDSLRKGTTEETVENLRRECGEISDRLLALAGAADSRESRIINDIAAAVRRFDPESIRSTSPTAIAEARTAEAMPGETPSAAEVPKGSNENPGGESPDPVATTTATTEPQVPPAAGESHPAAGSSKIPTTFIVLAKPDFQFRIDLEAAGTRLPGPASVSNLFVPESASGLLSPPAPAWVPIINDRIRESLSGAPVFVQKQSGAELILRGNVTAGFGEKFGDSWVIRFAADRGRIGPDFQIMVLKPDSAGNDYPLHFPVNANLSRIEKDSQVIQLTPPAVAELRPLVLGEENGKLYLRFESKEGTVRSEAVEFAGGPIPFSKLRLDLATIAGSAEGKGQIEEQWKKLTAVKEGRETFQRTFAQAGDSEQLFKGMGKFKLNTTARYTFSTVQEISLEPLAALDLPEATLDEYVKKHRASGIRPPLVDYLQHLAAEILKMDGEILDFGKPGSTDRNLIESLERVRAPGGWREAGDFENVRKQWESVTKHAEKRTPGIPDPKAPLPERRPGETLERYHERMNERQRGINTDLFFQNWARIFSKSEIDRVWPWFIANGKIKDLDARLKLVEERRSALQKKAAEVQNTGPPSLESLGSFFVDCEIAQGRTPTRTLRLIRFESPQAAAEPKNPEPAAPASLPALPK